MEAITLGNNREGKFCEKGTSIKNVFYIEGLKYNLLSLS